MGDGKRCRQHHLDIEKVLEVPTFKTVLAQSTKGSIAAANTLEFEILPKFRIIFGYLKNVDFLLLSAYFLNLFLPANISNWQMLLLKKYVIKLFFRFQ